MILATDVHYANSTATAAGVLFEHWSDPEPKREYVQKIEEVAPYESGHFYKRELPCILKLLKTHRLSVDCIVVDGYVYLDDDLRPGLGKYLFDALDGSVIVIGVAKAAFQSTSKESEILRGKSEKPLYVTTTSKLDTAKGNIMRMHGEFRIPTLLKRVDNLCRAKLE